MSFWTQVELPRKPHPLLRPIPQSPYESRGSVPEGIYLDSYKASQLASAPDLAPTILSQELEFLCSTQPFLSKFGGFMRATRVLIT